MNNTNRPLTGHLEILIGLTVTQTLRGEDQPRKYTVLDSQQTRPDSMPYLTVLSESGLIRRVHLSEVEVARESMEELRLRAHRRHSRVISTR